MVGRVLPPGASPSPASPPPQPHLPPLPPPPPPPAPPAPPPPQSPNCTLVNCTTAAAADGAINATRWGNVSSYLREAADAKVFVGFSGGALAGLSLAGVLVILAWVAGLTYVASPGMRRGAAAAAAGGILKKAKKGDGDVDGNGHRDSGEQDGDEEAASTARAGLLGGKCAETSTSSVRVVAADGRHAPPGKKGSLFSKTPLHAA